MIRRNNLIPSLSGHPTAERQQGQQTAGQYAIGSGFRDGGDDDVVDAGNLTSDTKSEITLTRSQLTRVWVPRSVPLA